MCLLLVPGTISFLLCQALHPFPCLARGLCEGAGPRSMPHPPARATACGSAAARRRSPCHVEGPCAIGAQGAPACGSIALGDACGAIPPVARQPIRLAHQWASCPRPPPSRPSPPPCAPLEVVKMGARASHPNPSLAITIDASWCYVRRPGRDPSPVLARSDNANRKCQLSPSTAGGRHRRSTGASRPRGGTG